MLTIKYILIPSLLLSVLGCRSSREAQKASVLLAEANSLIEQEAGVTQEWGEEYGKVFTPRNRAEFPANREVLRAHAENITKLLGRSAALQREAAGKYEEASRLLAGDKEKRYSTLLASSLRKGVEATDLFREQVGLVHSGEIKDQKTFNERFMNSARLIEQKIRERDDLQAEGKRILGNQ